MAGLKLQNRTPFAVRELLLADTDGRDLLTLVVKATYSFDATGAVWLAEEQVAVSGAGVWHGEPGESSARYEPEVAPFKLATDVVLVGHAWPDRRGATSVDVMFRCGPLQKWVRVFGDRQWYRQAGFARLSHPQPFERIPLIWERAFGGWDRSSPDEREHTLEARNPVGIGYHGRHGNLADGDPAPNLEDPAIPIGSAKDTPPPAGFGFIGPGWLPRSTFGGTYDDAWSASRAPLLPQDFDPRFYNAAPADQIVPGLRGDEPVTILNASALGPLNFVLPGEPPPLCTARVGETEPVTKPGTLDTVIVDTDVSSLLLIWRASFPVHRKVHQIEDVIIEHEYAARIAGAAAAAV